jgi:asparagine synthase (glutamine-hydrolysing)
MSLDLKRRGQPAWAAIDIILGPGWGWSQHVAGERQIHIRGYVFDGSVTLTGAAAARHAAALLPEGAADDDIKAGLTRLAGHFALVISSPKQVVATVDRIRSTPLVFSSRDGQISIDDQGRRLRDKLRLGSGDIDPAQALSVAMAGYSIGAATLYRGLKQLRAGEALVVDGRGARTLRWFVYDAWRTEPMKDPEKELSDLHRFMMERLARSAAGRRIAVPLSAGLDSRMIASGLKAAGYRDVLLFSYGRAGNHEAETARQVAERLGYPWTFVPFTTSGQKAMFADAHHEQALWQDADTCGGVPFEQDWTAITALRASGALPADAIIVNGQSGDFITGNHAPPALMDLPATVSSEERERQIMAAIAAKHFRLWLALATPVSDAVIARLLAQEAREAGATFSPDEAAHGIYEMIEYQDRQAKYVVSGQRNYDSLGVDWRLPLWDDEYVLFWRRAEACLKRDQGLYRRVLERDNWGGVWQGIKVNAKTIRPRWLIPSRIAAKAACAPLGRDRWHDVERRVFGWWMDPLRLSAVVPYGRALRSGRGARHAVAWIAERYLAQHGVDVEGIDDTGLGMPQ